MSATELMTVAQVQDGLPDIVDRLERGHGRIVITKDERPAAVLLSLDDLVSLLEAVEVLREERDAVEVRAMVVEDGPDTRALPSRS